MFLSTTGARLIPAASPCPCRVLDGHRMPNPASTSFSEQGLSTFDIRSNGRACVRNGRCLVRLTPCEVDARVGTGGQSGCVRDRRSANSTRPGCVLLQWAFKHTERNIAETGLHTLLELLQNVQASPVMNAFYVSAHAPLGPV